MKCEIIFFCDHTCLDILTFALYILSAMTLYIRPSTYDIEYALQIEKSLCYNCRAAIYKKVRVR